MKLLRGVLKSLKWQVHCKLPNSVQIAEWADEKAIVNLLKGNAQIAKMVKLPN